MQDLLDSLQWKPWPKDPDWIYAEIDGVARVGRKQGGTRYFVRSLDDDGALGAWHHTNIERADAIKILDQAIETIRLQTAAP